MKKSIVFAAVLGLTLVLAASAVAQTGVRMYERVTPMGTETVTEFTGMPFSGIPLVMPMLTPPGLVWNYPDGGLVWIARNVSVGNRGTQALAVCELNNEQNELFSVFDSNPPTPIWTDSSIFGVDTGFGCDSASAGDYHVAMYQVNSPDIYNRIPVVNGYTSASATPIWTWQYAGGTINYGSKVAIDRDATVVAIAVFNDNTLMLDLFFLDPATGNQISTYSQACEGLRGFDLSADGSTLYFHNGKYDVSIFDIATLTVIFGAQTGGSFDGHCISGDGTKFAFGGFGKVDIWEFDGSNWNSYGFSTGSGNYADEMDFSDDGTTLGFGVSQYSPSYSQTEAYIMDIATKTITAHVVNSSNGTYQDVCSAAAISCDGKYFALARWGDQANANPEVQILENGVGLIGTIDTRGSAFDADISRDGQVTVSGCKSVHANVGGNGGDVDCYDIGGEDMDLIGAPRINSTVQVDVYTNPNWYYAHQLGTADDPMGTPFGFGTLYLDLTPPNLYILLPVMQADNTGLGSLNGFVPNDPSIVGLTVFLQALFSPDGSAIELSEDYLTMTFLPM